ncbi:LemA family protein [Candidatus Woesearchaeota archaeon]|nr:LemA family protein [Candidatus Woesearchaeota archaeon]
MSTGTKVAIGIGVLLVIILLWFVGAYNGLVNRQTAVDSMWGNVQADYQRRMDLVPNLVNTVKGYAAHEEGLFTEITELRSRWQEAAGKGDVNNAISAAQGMEGALSRLLVVVENYPDLKASQNFLALQDQLEGTENRIAFSRKKYNEAVQDYNAATRRLPTNIIAGMFGFGPRQFFEAQAGAEKAPTVSFT